MKLETEVSKQTWHTLQISCRLQTDGRTDKVYYRQNEQSEICILNIIYADIMILPLFSCKLAKVVISSSQSLYYIV